MYSSQKSEEANLIYTARKSSTNLILHSAKMKMLTCNTGIYFSL